MELKCLLHINEECLFDLNDRSFKEFFKIYLNEEISDLTVKKLINLFRFTNELNQFFLVDIFHSIFSEFDIELDRRKCYFWEKIDKYKFLKFNKEQISNLFNKLYCKKNLLANTKIIINFYLNSNSKLEFLYFKPKNHIDNILKENIYNNKKEFYLYLRDLIFIRNSEFKKNSISYLIGNLTSYIDILKILLDNEENYIDNSCVLFKRIYYIFFNVQSKYPPLKFDEKILKKLNKEITSSTINEELFKVIIFFKKEKFKIFFKNDEILKIIKKYYFLMIKNVEFFNDFIGRSRIDQNTLLPLETIVSKQCKFINYLIMNFDYIYRIIVV